MDRFAHRVVAAKRKRHVGDPPGHFGSRQIGLDPARGFDEIQRVAIVRFNPRGDGENIGIEDNVLGDKIEALAQQAVAARADGLAALQGVGLTGFIEGHDHHRSAVALTPGGLFEKLVFPGLEADRVDDGFALHAAQTRFDHAPFRGVQHNRHARDIRLGGEQIQEGHHRRLGVEHALVHIDVDNLRAVFYLSSSDIQGGRIIIGQNKLLEARRAGDIAALADIHEQAFRAKAVRLQSA